MRVTLKALKDDYFEDVYCVDIYASTRRNNIVVIDNMSYDLEELKKTLDIII